jgi:hypothetical protein
MPFRAFTCPSCRCAKYEGVRARDSRAAGRGAYRLCNECGTAYRPFAPPVAVIFVAIVGIAAVAVGIVGCTFGNYPVGAVFLVAGLPYCLTVFSYFGSRDSRTVGLLPRFAGEPSESLKLWLAQNRGRASAIIHVLRRAAGVSLATSGAALSLLGACAIGSEFKALHDGRARIGGFGMAAIGLASLAGVGLHLFGRKLGARRATRVLSRDSRPPILLLRSFDDDEIALPKPASNAVEENYLFFLPWGGAHNTLENTIVRAFGAVGPVIAIGSPGRLIAPAGAARTWFPHTVWKDRVEDLTNWSQRVVFVLGDLDRKGLAW